MMLIAYDICSRFLLRYSVFPFFCYQDKAQNAFEDVGDSLKGAGKDAQRKAEDVGDSAKDTARDVKRDADKGADRISN